MTRQLDLTVQGVVGTNPVLSRVGEKARPYCRFRVAVTPTYRTDQGWNRHDLVHRQGVGPAGRQPESLGA